MIISTSVCFLKISINMNSITYALKREQMCYGNCISMGKPVCSFRIYFSPLSGSFNSAWRVIVKGQLCIFTNRYLPKLAIFLSAPKKRVSDRLIDNKSSLKMESNKKLSVINTVSETSFQHGKLEKCLEGHCKSMIK